MATTTEAALLKGINTTLNDTISPYNTCLIDEAGKLWTGPFYALTALHDTQIDVSECDTGIIEKAAGATTQAITVDITIPQGMTIYGEFGSIELISGTLIAYTRNEIIVTVEA